MGEGSKDGATSDACCESKRIETRSLAEQEGNQHERYKCTESDIPRLSTPPMNNLRRPTDLVNPPRRRGRLKRSLVRSEDRIWRRSTYQVVRPRRGQSGRIERSGYVVYSQEMVQAQYRGAIREDEAARAYRGRTARTWTARPLGEPRLSVSGKRASAALSDSSNSKLRHFIYLSILIGI